jgi:hypothetical protein
LVQIPWRSGSPQDVFSDVVSDGACAEDCNMDTEKTAPAAATNPVSTLIEIETRPRMFFPVSNFLVSFLVRCAWLS